MDKSISFYDSSPESFYHGLILGLIALMDNQYKIKSNRKSGCGRYDISLFPKTSKYPCIITEFKWGINLDTDSLNDHAKATRHQIDRKRYDSETIEIDIPTILKLGSPFPAKKS